MIADIDFCNQMNCQQWLNQEKKLKYLLKNPQKLRCQQCLTPLPTLTKIIALEENSQSNMINQDKACKLLCIPCFCGYRSRREEIGQAKPIKYLYYVWKRFDLQQQELNGWSPFECFELLACLQNFGPHIDQTFCQELAERTGKTRNIQQIQEQYKSFQNQLFGHESFNINLREDQLLSNPLIVKQSEQKAKFIEFLNLSKKEQIIQAERFLSLLNYDCPVQHLRKYPDNLSEYMSRVVAVNPVVKQNLIQTREFSNVVLEKNSTWLTFLLFNQLNERDDVDRLHFYLIAKYCQKFITRKKISKIISSESKENALKRVYQLSHPQISDLISEDKFKEHFGKLIQLRKKRVQLFQQIKEKSKQQGRRSSRKLSQRGIEFPIRLSSDSRRQDQYESEMVE